MSIKEAAMVEAVKATPASAVSGLVLAGVPLNEWVLIGSGILILLQVFFLLRDKWWRQRGKP